MTRICHEHAFVTDDGASLFYRHWPAVEPRRGAVLLLHRGHEHSGRMAHLVEELGLSGFDFFAWDARGHGLSPGARGDAPNFAVLVRDVQSFLDHVCSAHGLHPSDVAVVAQSVGAVIAATWAHDYAPTIRALVLASPAFKVKLYVPFARPALRFWHRLRGNFFVNSYVKSRFLTHDPERQASFDSDPLVTRAISVRVLLGLYDAAKRVVTDAQAISLPTQMLVSGADWVVHRAPQFRFYKNLGSPIKELHVLDGYFHDTLGEKDRSTALAKVRSFLLMCFEQSWQRPDLRDADLHGATHDEAEMLARPLPLLSPARLYWAFSRFGLKVGSLLSEGIRLGQRTGFDSGSTLDYVYRDLPMGLGPLGRLVDRHYLDAIGWRGIRQRKLNLEDLLRRTLARLAAEGRPARILDIAAGHGRYVMEALAGSSNRPESILLRDFSNLNVEKGRDLIIEKGFAPIARFELGDAFDRASLAAITPRPTVAIVSGLYELFPGNMEVRRSLAGLGDLLEPGSYLLYTGQPWHPQLEMIARTLTSHRDGSPWVMRRRTQAELDQLVSEAGFEKLEQHIDEWGIFTVSLARRKS